VTNMTVGRQRHCKHISKVTQSTVGPPLLSSRLLGTFRSNGHNTNNNRSVLELLEVAISLRFALSYKRDFVREFSEQWFFVRHSSQ
jgi:hypothetical protein